MQDPVARLLRRHRIVSLLLILLLIGVVIRDGADRVPANPSTPLVVQESTNPPQPFGETLRVASFNIHGGKGLADVIQLERTAELLRACDLAGIYEVRAGIQSPPPNQAADLGARLDMTSVFAATERHWWREHFGNGLLTRSALPTVQRLPLPGTRGKAYRNVILAHIPWRGESLHVLATHIDRAGDRETQLNLVIPLFLGLEPPAILMGDLNTPASDPLLSQLLREPTVRSPLHEALRGEVPLENIDWIFTRGLTTVAAELVANDASDHPVVRAELRRTAIPLPPATDHVSPR